MICMNAPRRKGISRHGRPDPCNPLRTAGLDSASAETYRIFIRGTDPDNGSERFPAVNFEPADAPAVSPLLHVTLDDPPTLLIHGDQDGLVNISHSHRMYEALHEHRVESKLIIIEGAEHGFRGAEAEQVTAAMVDWFEVHLSADN